MYERPRLEIHFVILLVRVLCASGCLATSAKRDLILWICVALL